MSFFDNSYLVRDAAKEDNTIVKDGIQIGENAISSLTNDVVNCEVCGVHIAKYKCPGCFCQTCSLACSKQHKLDTTCSGVRSKTHFVERKQYSENDMMSDYNFLEEVGRTVDNAARENMKRDAALNPNKKRPLANNNNNNRNKRGRNQPQKDGAEEEEEEGDAGVDSVTKISLAAAQELEKQGTDAGGTYRDKQLIMQAKKRNIHLIRIAEGLKKRRENNTHWRDKPSRMIWTIEWQFPEIDASRRVLEHKSEESKTLADILAGFMEKEENKDLLEKYPIAMQDQLQLFFVIPLRHANKPALYPLKNTDSLQEAFKFKKILEYPTILVLGPSADTSSKSTSESIENTSALETTVSADTLSSTSDINKSHPILEKYSIEEPLTLWPRRPNNNNNNNNGKQEDKKILLDTTDDNTIESKKSKIDGEGEDEDADGNEGSSSSDSSDSSDSGSSSDSSSDSDSDSDTNDSGSEDEDEDEDDNNGDKVNAPIDNIQTGEPVSIDDANLRVGQAIIEAFNKDFSSVE
ncbi:Box C/D snoRNA protein 1 [Entomortierella beljakovae]|nr:Box C/D snoRNA protein 1 [Entomortierella beljakovae]